MGLLRRRPLPVTIGPWVAESRAGITCAGDLVADPLAAIEIAYGAFFYRPGRSASLAIYTYARFCPESGGAYMVGFRVRRFWGGSEEAGSVVYADGAWGEWFADAHEADYAAQIAAALLLAGPPWRDPLTSYANPDAINDWFVRDGDPGL